METLGGMNKGTLKVIDRLAEQKSKTCLIPKNEIKQNIINMITTNVFRKIANQVIDNFEDPQN